MAEMRVASRVAEGGHNIPADVIHRRYWLGLNNMFNIFIPIVDHWSIFDNHARMQPVVEMNDVKDIAKLNKIKESCQNKNA